MDSSENRDTAGGEFANKSKSDLIELLSVVDSYKSTIPESVVRYYMEKSGMTIQDPRIVSVVALAADKFLADTVFDAKEQSLLRRKNVKLNNKRKLDSDQLDVCDLEGGLSQLNVFWRRSRRSGETQANTDA